MNDKVKLNLIKLKIKAKSLAAEARIIRKEERKLTGSRRDIIAEHRRTIVRDEARATQLAIACIKGRPYTTVEPKCNNLWHRDNFIVPKVEAMCKRYAYMDRYTVGKWIKND